MTYDGTITERKRIVSRLERTRNGHELLEVEERLPGHQPTDVGTPITDSTTYRTRYWRCLNCGQERNRRSEYTTACSTQRAPVPRADGGYLVDDPRTAEALSADLSVRPATQGDVYTVSTERGFTHRVDLQAERCTCRDNRRRGAFCVHLRRADIEARVGTVPESHD